MWAILRKTFSSAADYFSLYIPRKGKKKPFFSDITKTISLFLGKGCTQSYNPSNQFMTQWQSSIQNESPLQ